MGISFSGKNWIPSLWNKADSYSGKEQVCVNPGRAGYGSKERGCMSTTPAGEHSICCWVLWEKLFQSCFLFWNSPLREHNQFLFHNCLDQKNSDLLPLCPWEIFTQNSFPCLFKQLTCVLEERARLWYSMGYLYRALLYQCLKGCNKKRYLLQYVLHMPIK